MKKYVCNCLFLRWLEAMGRAVHPITQVTSLSFLHALFAVASLHISKIGYFIPNFNSINSNEQDEWINWIALAESDWCCCGNAHNANDGACWGRITCGWTWLDTTQTCPLWQSRTQNALGYSTSWTGPRTHGCNTTVFWKMDVSISMQASGQPAR